MERNIKLKFSRIISVVLSILMVLTMIPYEVSGYSINETMLDEAENIKKGIEWYFLSFPKGESGKPRLDTSLSAFALKSAGIDIGQFEIAVDDSVYSYKDRFGTTDTGSFSKYTYEKNKDWAEVAEITDQIFDYLALEMDASPLIAQLLERQNDNGWFDETDNSAYQAKAIMALDAYYGKDYEEEWPNYEENTNKGRIGALKALVTSQYFMGGTTNGSFKGSLFIPRIYNKNFGPFNLTGGSIQITAVAVTALSNYTDCKFVVEIEGKNVVIGDYISNAIDIACQYAESVEGGLKEKKGMSSSIASYWVPAFLSCGEIDKIEEYELIQSLKDKQKENGCYKSYHNDDEPKPKLSTNVETQQVLIALGDLLAGESAYTRIKSPRAEAVEKLLHIADSLEVPTDVYADPEGGDDNNYTGKIDLLVPDEEGLTVVWKSSAPDVVSYEGIVRFPEDRTESVILTAELSLKYGSGDNAVNKTAHFKVNVQSKIISRLTGVLDEQLTELKDKYGEDISVLGFEGLGAVYNVSGSLEGYEVSGLSDERSAEACAKNVIQLILTNKNPYNYDGKNYVDILKSHKDEYGGNPFVLAALNALGEKPESALIENIAAIATTGSSIVTTEGSIYYRSLAVNTLASNFDYGSATTYSAITTSPSAITMKDIADEFTDYAVSVQNEKGMFGNDETEHAAVVSALVSLGEDLFSEKYIKNGTNVYDAVKNERYGTVSRLNVLGDVITQKSLWQRIKLTRADFDILLNTAETVYETGTGKYSALSMQSLKNAILDAKNVTAGGSFSEKYFNLRGALNNLNIDVLPEFTDLSGYSEESIDNFKKAAEKLSFFLRSNRKSSISDAKQYSQELVQAYSDLKLINELVKISGHTYAKSYSYSDILPKNVSDEKFSVSLKGGLSPTQEYALPISEKTSKGFDEIIKHDVSNMTYWGVFGVSAMDKDVSKYVVYDVTKHKRGMFLTYQATDYGAIILQLILTGENPYNYNGINYVEKLQEIGIKNQGIFGGWGNNIWALMALDAAGADYDPILINVVAGQAASETFDLDMRGWALAASSNHMDDPKVEALIQEALTNIESMQVKDGEHAGYFKHLLYDDYNIFTHSCVVSGLVAAGEDLTSERWTKNGSNPLDVIKRYQLEDGRIYDKYENGALINPGFNKDAVIALGDAVQGSNVWQRTYLDENKLADAVEKGEEALKNASEQVPEYKKSALEAAIKSAEEVNDIKGNGHIYFRLLEAIKDLNEVELQEFAEKSFYTPDSFLQFENALKASALILMQTEAKASDLNNSCIGILNAYNSLKEAETNPGGPGDGEKITVTFKLLGAVKHGGSGTIQTLRKGNLKTWIPKITVEINKGSKVYDVFTKVLDENGYNYIGDEDNYVSRIITPDGLSLGEFDNGQPSGWMYTVNGKHPNVGLRAYSLSDGDDIIWHYTDDYTQEEGSEKWNNQIFTPKIDRSGVTAEIESKKDKDGTAEAKLTSEEVKAFAQALRNIENKDEMSANMKIKLPEGSKGLKVEISEEIMRALKNKDKLSLIISSDMWGMTLESKALKSIIEQYGTKKLEISFAEANVDNLTEDTKKLLGDRKIYNISVYSNGKYISSFGEGELNCHIPYDAGNENVYKLSVYRITDEGNTEKIEKSSYDGKSKLFSFTVNSLSHFAVGYDTSIKISFGDVHEGHWAYEHIMKLAKRGILNGRTENIFAPEDGITRAEFVTILSKMSGDDLDMNSVSAFDDVKTDDWFASYAKWANEKGVAMGDGNKFNPSAQISRQDMAVMLVRYIKYVGKELTREQSDFLFADDREISGYAREAAYYMTEGGIINGRGNNVFAPGATATRAEAAKMINSMLEKLEFN